MILHTTEPRRASAKERARVHAWIRKWQREFYMHITRINVLFHDYPRDDSESEMEGAAAQMDCAEFDTYHYVCLNIYPRFFEDGREEQEMVIVHEMMHPITFLLANQAIRLGEGQLVTAEEVRLMQERVTDWLARIVFYGGSAKEVERRIPVKKKRTRR